MDLEQYKSKIKQIDQKAILRKRHVAKEFALANNKISIGDIISDHIGKIKVIEINIHFSNPPQCIYVGLELKKDGTVTKREKIRNVYQSNLEP